MVVNLTYLSVMNYCCLFTTGWEDSADSSCYSEIVALLGASINVQKTKQINLTYCYMIVKLLLKTSSFVAFNIILVGSKDRWRWYDAYLRRPFIYSIARGLHRVEDNEKYWRIGTSASYNPVLWENHQKKCLLH
jgi:hypothetical protein